MIGVIISPLKYWGTYKKEKYENKKVF